MRKRLDLNPHELYDMRKQGMTNQQIASSLDVCVATVHKYLKGYAKEENKQKEGVCKLPPAEKLPEVMVLQQRVAINGFSFDINMNEKKFSCESQRWNTNLYLDFEHIDDFIDALKAVKKICQ